MISYQSQLLSTTVLNDRPIECITNWITNTSAGAVELDSLLLLWDIYPSMVF